MIRIVCVMVAVLLLAGSAMAACVNPAMPEQAVIYNADFNTMQYCSNSTWVTFDGLGIYCTAGQSIVMSSAGWECSP